MVTFLKNIIKAIVMIALLFAMIALAFLPLPYWFYVFGPGAMAAWLIFYLIVFVTVGITLSQENKFSKRIESECKAFWGW